MSGSPLQLLSSKSYTVSLGRWDNPLLSSVFEELVRISRPILKSYVGDLHYDSLTLNEDYSKGGRFIWGCRKTGTNMKPATLQNYELVSSANKVVYLVSIYKRRNDGWEASFEEMTPQNADSLLRQ